jgi:hypothetical protein
MRYLLAFLVAVGFIVLVFILIVRSFGGDDQASVQTELTDYARTQTVMRLTVEGRVNIDQEHRVARITVGRSENKIEIIHGYEGNVVDSRTYNSNETAYATFLRALDLRGYTRGDDDPALADSRGVCAGGRTYTFEIVTGSATVQRFWSSSCGSGTFKGNDAQIRGLFHAQIPDYTRLTGGMGLSLN